MTVDWQPLVDSYLATHRTDGVGIADVDLAEQWLANASGYTAPGSWRGRIVNGTLWVRPIHLYAAWMERASVLRILFMALRQAAPGEIPDSEFVFAAGDHDPTHCPTCGCGAASAIKPPHCHLPIFVNARAAGSSALPLPEQTWVGVRDTPPWCQQSAELARTARALTWDARDDRAYFAGSCATGASRQALLALALAHAKELDVRDSGYDASGTVHRQERQRANRRHDRLGSSRGAGNGTGGTGGTSRTRTSPTHACRYRYLLSIPGFGYASRLRALLACGSVVVHIPHASHEFFEPLLKDGVHLVRLARGGVGTGGGPLARRAVMTSLLPALSELRNDQPRAQRIARAARLFAVGHLSFASVLRYTRVLLGAYGRLYRSPPPGSGDELWRRDDDLEEASRYMRIDNEADLMRVMRLCSCTAPNSPCMRQPGAGLSSPVSYAPRPCPGARGKLPGLTGGWAPTQVAERRCCPMVRPKETRGVAPCWEARCCRGWDCPDKPLACERP